MSPDPKSEEQQADDAGEPTGDVESLLALAKERRAARDLKGCLEAYQKAAELGSAEAGFASALFYLSGGVVPQDLREGATRLRNAAEQGSIPARVYLGNLYELGIHYKADPEKADVWYRSAARASKIEAEPGTDEHAQALAELGCARYVLALVETGAVSGDEKTRLLQRAKIHGYGLRVRDDAAEGGGGDRLTFTEALVGADAVAEPTPPPPNVKAPAPGPMRERANTMPETPGAMRKTDPPVTGKATKQGKPKDTESAELRSAALASFGYALLFASAGIGAAYAATLAGKELVAQNHPLPLLGQRTNLLFPIVLGLVGVLPAWLVYRLGAVLKALVIGAALAGVGWIAWGTGRGAVHAARDVQALAFGLAGFLAGLLVLGLLGGTKLGRKKRRS